MAFSLTVFAILVGIPWNLGAPTVPSEIRTTTNHYKTTAYTSSFSAVRTCTAMGVIRPVGVEWAETREGIEYTCVCPFSTYVTGGNVIQCRVSIGCEFMGDVYTENATWSAMRKGVNYICSCQQNQEVECHLLKEQAVVCDFEGWEYGQGDTWDISRDGVVYKCVCPEEIYVSNSTNYTVDCQPVPVPTVGHECPYKQVTFQPGEVWFDTHQGQQFECICPTELKDEQMDYYCWELNEYGLSLIMEEKNWTDAQHLCEQSGKRLLVVDIPNKEKALEEFMSNEQPYDLWLGATDGNSHVEWKWLSGQPVDQRGWFPGDESNPAEPNAALTDNQNCLMAKKKWGDGAVRQRYEWADVNCGEYAFFICENSPLTVAETWQLSFPNGTSYKSMTSDLSNPKHRDLVIRHEQKVIPYIVIFKSLS